jgi:hypothetical protein
MTRLSGEQPRMSSIEIVRRLHAEIRMIRTQLQSQCPLGCLHRFLMDLLKMLPGARLGLSAHALDNRRQVNVFHHLTLRTGICNHQSLAIRFVFANL